MNNEIQDLDSLKETLKERLLSKTHLLKFLFSLIFGASWLFAINYSKIQANPAVYWCVLIGGFILYRPALWLVTYLAIKYGR